MSEVPWEVECRRLIEAGERPTHVLIGYDDISDYVQRRQILSSAVLFPVWRKVPLEECNAESLDTERLVVTILRDPDRARGFTILKPCKVAR